MKSYDKITPEGTRDLLYEEYELLKQTEGILEKVFKSAGYCGIKTPALEFLDVFSGGVGEIPQADMYSLSDYRGRIMVMRPDSTKPVARVVSSRLKDREMPLRLYYNQTTYKRNKHSRLLSDEIRQTGIELVGAEGEKADTEVLMLAAKCLKRTCGGDYMLEIGHTGLFKELIASLDVSAKVKAQARHLIESKNYPALSVLLSSCGGCKKTADAINALPSLFGGVEVLDYAESIFDWKQGKEIISGIRKIYSALEDYAGGNVFIDLGLLNGYDYYSGLVFKGYCGGIGEAVLSGGRYDTLYSDYELDLPAVGFAVNTEQLLEQIIQSNNNKQHIKRPITIALTKGRLENDTARLLQAAGVDCEPIFNKGRKLIASICGGKYNVVFAKSRDVITYVQHGVCDIGIVGKDTIMEMGESFYEMLDLGFGKCRFALAAETGKDFYSGHNLKRIATKYPNVCRSYFQGKAMDVDIIRIDGSVELAPLLNLADGIVDIVETGTTLKENGLEVIDNIADISARAIVNIASLKKRKAAVEEFIQLLADGLKGER